MPSCKQQQTSLIPWGGVGYMDQSIPLGSIKNNSILNGLYQFFSSILFYDTKNLNGGKYFTLSSKYNY